MTDRSIVYAGALPQTTDFLTASKFAMFGDAFLALAALGNSASAPSTVVAGLPCTPTTPASLQVNVGPGAIFSLDATDATAYGDLGADPTQIFKMGIRPTTGALTITPPSTTGYSQVFLVQAILSDIDAGATVLSYYNSANPLVPLSGPANAGTSQNTTRTCVCTLALKAGVAAPTGSQANPAPDAGYTALYYVTVANGQTQIVSGNIVQANGGFAPFVNTALPYIPSAVQGGSWVYFVDGGAVNAAVVNLMPAISSYTAGLAIRVKMANAPTGACTINCNGLGAKSIVTSGGQAIAAGAWVAGDVVQLTYDGTNFQAAGIVKPDWYANDTGTTNALAVTLSPAPSAYFAGMHIDIKVANTVTGAATLNVNGLGAKNLVKGDQQALVSNNVVAGEVIRVIYDGTQFQVANLLSTNFRATTYTVYSFRGTYTWTCPPGVTQVKIRAVGAGGSGGAGVNYGGGSGGNAGAYVELIYNVVPGSNYTITVGQGGSASAGNGNAGGTTGFNGVFNISGGGGGTVGNGGGAATGSTSVVTGTVGMSVGGGTGQYGSGNNSSLAHGGAGAGSVFVCPSMTPLNTASGVLTGYTSIFGGGGSGGSSSNGTVANSGAGGDGCVILEY